MPLIPVSIVITTKNQTEIIDRAISLLCDVTDDIVIIHNGRADANDADNLLGCRVYYERWDGYGANKNKGVRLAKYDWILSLDADELPDRELIENLMLINLSKTGIVYNVRFKSYFGKTRIRYGKWGRDHHVRLFNRDDARWAESPVHEELLFNTDLKRVDLKGAIHHYSVTGLTHFKAKSELYARLNAEHYRQQGRHSSYVKLYLSPVFNFLKNYILFLGFLDGVIGWQIACETLRYTRLKYSLLRRKETDSAAKEVAITPMLLTEI